VLRKASKPDEKTCNAGGGYGWTQNRGKKKQECVPCPRARTSDTLSNGNDVELDRERDLAKAVCYAESIPRPETLMADVWIGGRP